MVLLNNKSATWKFSLNVDAKTEMSNLNYFMSNMLHYDFL